MTGSFSKGQRDGSDLLAVIQAALRHKHDSNSPDHDNPNAQSTPSKGLPSSALKSKVAQMENSRSGEQPKSNGLNQDHFGENETKRQPGLPGYGRHNSATSIPSHPTTGDKDDISSVDANGEDQGQGEGADGRGSGKHEKTIIETTTTYGDENRHGSTINSPEAKTYEVSTVPLPRSIGTNPQSSCSNQLRTMSSSIDSEDPKVDEEKLKDEEKMEPFESENNKKLIDEAGRRPGRLAGVKKEETPGPRNEIVLEPRVTHIHYHQEKKSTTQGTIRGPILKITPDGEKELPPGQTPDISRRSSAVDGHSIHAGPTEELADYEDEMGTDAAREDYTDREKDHWGSAFDGGDHTSHESHQGSGSGMRGGHHPGSGVGGENWEDRRRSSHGNKWSSLRRSVSSFSQSRRSDSHFGDDERRDRDDDIDVDAEEDGVDARSHLTPSHSHSQSQDASPQRSTPHERHPQPNTAHSSTDASKRWSMLRSRIIPSRFPNASGNSPLQPTPGPNKVSALAPTTIARVPVTTELFAGQLPVMILKTWLDRDEEGRRAVPVLLGNLRFRVGDSVGLRQGRQTGREMFKIECEYGDGVVKWVIYRELRDFLSLHAHYVAANFGTRVTGLRSSRHVEIPKFPQMSIPYWNRLRGTTGKDEMKDEKNEPIQGKSEYAQASRNALQQYLVDLIRAVLFRPESNRLCKFFELSALTLSLAPRGGFQGKAGYLKILSSAASRRANQPGLTPMSWIHHRHPKWFVVRDSYFVATDGPEENEFYDVFLLDGDFSIERPRRAYRTGFELLSGRSALKAIKGRKEDYNSDGDGIIQTMVDENDNPLTNDIAIRSGEGKGDRADVLQDDDEAKASQHTFFITNSQRKLKLVAKNARQMHQFIVSMERVAAQCVWAGRNRFDSFAPIRLNVAAQWLVDGRDYFWNLSRAINMAKDRIYIHDWWLSPELYLRRPGDERYRLDNLIQRKAEQGVKIFIIIYNEVSDKTTPVESLYAKKRMTGLHPNVMVQRSPSHFQTGTFYWSHHEKLCVIDETIAFMGGLDLCYGRWDTSQHIMTDENFTSADGPDGPVWRGKDYFNERVAEFKDLDKPFEDMFDRSKVPRMPWHDVGLQIVGQPARDLCRHFVQRWNLLIRTKNHTRKLPFLLPAADFTDRELFDLKLQGTCEVQICRSCGPWSMGTQTKIEHSIQNAYIKSIELSEHFVYIENQFFITSTVVDGITIENGIGDALVERIIRAYRQNQNWRACIVIPLLPGYTYPIDSSEASSVRLILECQNRTISRGTNSIFSRLKKEGIDPNDYITFFSLRGWTKFKSGALSTEQVYIHGKTMVVDDRLVLCGSANINERSQRGDRDSELVAVIRDTDMIDGTMGGKPFKVGRFAHTLRMRLMREHVGVDVDAIDEEQLMLRQPVADEDEIEIWDPDHEQEDEGEHQRGVTRIKRTSPRERFLATVENGVSSVTKGLSENTITDIKKIADKVIHPAKVLAQQNIILTAQDGEQSERQDYDISGNGATEQGFASSVIPTLEEKTIFERRPSATHANGEPLFNVIEREREENETRERKGEPEEAVVPGETKEDIAIGGKGNEDSQKGGAPVTRGNPTDKEMFGAPANAGKEEIEDGVIPPRPGHQNSGRGSSTTGTGGGDIVSSTSAGAGLSSTSFNEAKESAAIDARKVLRKHLSSKVGTSPWSMPTPTPKINPNRFHDPLDERFWKDMWVAVAVHNTEIYRKVFRCVPDDLVTSWAQYKAFANHAEKFNKVPENVVPHGSEPVKVTHSGGGGTHGAGGGGSGGGIVGQVGVSEDNQTGAEVRKPDIINGKPNDKVGDGGTNNVGGGRSGGTSGQTGQNWQGDESRKPSGENEAWAEWEMMEMEELLNEVRGHLVIYPTRFLEAEDMANNFLFNSDKILPLPIYD